MTAGCGAGLVISQVYGGGGNSGAPLSNDFIELHNAGSTPVALGEFAVHYSSASGATWLKQVLPAVNLAPGGYFLIQESAGVVSALPLPTPDFVPLLPIAMGATQGKVALTASSVTLSGFFPLAQTVDIVGYGIANCAEGAATPPASNVTSVARAGAGCQDTGNNATDFAVGAPAPRNGATPPVVCACALGQ
ncbi:MAG TPA: lamin tail domain-containing protein [Kofleriaceae bacterium]|nr:lamin tail domain-containing protein [Kofleriaceae bacterium]